jgi:hypothetical protein
MIVIKYILLLSIAFNWIHAVGDLSVAAVLLYS